MFRLVNKALLDENYTIYPNTLSKDLLKEIKFSEQDILNFIDCLNSVSDLCNSTIISFDDFIKDYYKTNTNKSIKIEISNEFNQIIDLFPNSQLKQRLQFKKIKCNYIKNNNYNFLTIVDDDYDNLVYVSKNNIINVYNFLKFNYKIYLIYNIIRRKFLEIVPENNNNSEIYDNIRKKIKDLISTLCPKYEKIPLRFFDIYEQFTFEPILKYNITNIKASASSLRWYSIHKFIKINKNEYALMSKDSFKCKNMDLKKIILIIKKQAFILKHLFFTEGSFSNFINNTFDISEKTITELNNISDIKRINHINPVSNFISVKSERILKEKIEHNYTNLCLLTKLKEKHDNIIKCFEIFNDEILKLKKENEQTIELVSGDSIRNYYYYKNYDKNSAQETGLLWGSCMRHYETQKHIDFYAKHPECIKLLIVRNNKNYTKIQGRAVVYYNNETNEHYVDRLYFNNNLTKNNMVKYIDSNYNFYNIHHRCNVATYNNTKNIKNFKIPFNNLIDFTTSLPYLDSLKFTISFENNKTYLNHNIEDDARGKFYNNQLTCVTPSLNNNFNDKHKQFLILCKDINNTDYALNKNVIKKDSENKSYIIYNNKLLWNEDNKDYITNIICFENNKIIEKKLLKSKEELDKLKSNNFKEIDNSYSIKYYKSIIFYKVPPFLNYYDNNTLDSIIHINYIYLVKKSESLIINNILKNKEDIKSLIKEVKSYEELFNEDSLPIVGGNLYEHYEKIKLLFEKNYNLIFHSIAYFDNETFIKAVSDDLSWTFILPLTSFKNE